MNQWPPDRLGYITAIRAWQVYAPGYLASSSWIWEPKQPLRFRCHYHPDEHELSPDLTCTCGIYGVSQVTLANKTHFNAGFSNAIGEVALWGHVIVHEQGYRAEYAYPLSLGFLGRFPSQKTLLREVSLKYGLKALTREEVEALVLSRTAPPEVPMCPLCQVRHHFKDCTHPDREKMIKRALRDIEYRRQYNLKKRGKL